MANLSASRRVDWPILDGEGILTCLRVEAPVFPAFAAWHVCGGVRIKISPSARATL